MRLAKTLALLPATLLLATVAAAQEVKYVEENGVTYKETRHVIKRTLPETRVEQQERVVYRDRYTTDLVPSERRYMAPVTEYRWEPQWVTPWNPFAAPYVTYRWVPVTKWVEKTELVKIPQSRHEQVPEKITLNVPVTSHKSAEEVYYSRVPISVKPSTTPGPASPATGEGDESVARRNTFSRRYDDNPPREGDWRPAASITR
jgi:hypothetical protein